MSKEKSVPLTLLCKLGSIAVHADESFSPGGHDYDRQATLALINDSEVSGFLADMQKQQSVPLKRTTKRPPAEVK